MSKPTYDELEKAFREAVLNLNLYAAEPFEGLIERLDASANVKLTKDQALDVFVESLCKAVEDVLDAGVSMEELRNAEGIATAKVALHYAKKMAEEENG